MNCAGTKTIGLLPTASRKTNLVWQIRTEHHSPIVKDIKIKKTHTYLGAAERWMTFPEDKSIVCKYIIMQKSTSTDLITMFYLICFTDLTCILVNFNNLCNLLQKCANFKIIIFYKNKKKV